VTADPDPAADPGSPDGDFDLPHAIAPRQQTASSARAALDLAFMRRRYQTWASLAGHATSHPG